MEPDQLRAIMDFLRDRVHLKDAPPEGDVVVVFDSPSIEDMISGGLDPEGSRSVLGAPWWDEMVEDIIDTPEMCEPDEPPEKVLEYARDVVSEYIRKRAEL